MRNFFTKIVGCLVLLIVISCNKHLDIESSRIQNDEGAWDSFEDARGGLFGCYALARAALAVDNGHWMYGELRLGEFVSSSRLDLKAIIENQLTAQFPLLKRLTNWNRFYAAINACNLFIENSVKCKADSKYSDSYHKLDLAQVRALRAYLYFYISRIWGDVPLILESNEGGNFETVSRTKQDIVLSIVENELLTVISSLPNSYLDNETSVGYIPNYYGLNGSQWNGTPINKLDAYALLVHVLVWQERYSEANGYIHFLINFFGFNNLIINVNHIPLKEGIENSFSGKNQSQLINSFLGFQFLKSTGEYTTEGHIEDLTLASTSEYFMSKSIPDIFIPKQKIIDLFTIKGGLYDKRFGIDTTIKSSSKYFTFYFENFNTEYPVFKKIRFVDGNDNKTGKYPKFNSTLVFSRVVEIYLLDAEIKIANGDFVNGLKSLNLIRENRGLTKLKFPSENGRQVLLKELHSERKRELMGEAWSWYDLIRYKRLDGTDGKFNELLNSGGIYWPVDPSIISSNPGIEQITYWK